MQLASSVFRGIAAPGLVFLLLTLGAFPSRADEATDAKNVTTAFFRFTDRNDAEGAYSLAGEQLRRTAPKRETMAGLQTWFATKGGSASSHEIIAQRAISEDEARAMYPQATAKGNVYVFRYRSKYPKAVFFEDIYVSRDSDGVLRINGHVPQPAE